MTTLRQAAEQALEALQATMATHDSWEAVCDVKDEAITALREALAQREWVGLTDEERNQVAWSCGAMSADWLEFADAIEAKLREKNA